MVLLDFASTRQAAKWAGRLHGRIKLAISGLFCCPAAHPQLQQMIPSTSVGIIFSC